MKYLLLGIMLVVSISAFAMSGKKAVFKDITVQEFAEKVKENNVVIIDMRTLQELGNGYVEGALNIDFYSNEFKAKLNALDKDKTYLIYCRSGNRSGRAMRVMKGLKFKEVYNLIGGIGALVRYGYPLVEPA